MASKEKCAELAEKLDADAVEMEGAAVAQVCYQRGIGCLVIRSISDKADESAVVDKQKFYALAARNSAALVGEDPRALTRDGNVECVLDRRKDGTRPRCKTEVVAGVTTFLTMAYIIFVNPTILSAAGMDKHALVIVTCIVSAVMTAITGLAANAPIAMAPGMGLNAFLAYSLVKGGQITWQTGLGVVFLSGLLAFVLTLLGLRKRLVEAIPMSLISAISVGIGLFITFIGLREHGHDRQQRGDARLRRAADREGADRPVPACS